jgi:hypothetical protein
MQANKKAARELPYEKAARKMLVKLTEGSNAMPKTECCGIF